MVQANTFPRHGSYVDSGIDWLGEIPSDWSLESIRAVTQLKSEKNRPELQVLSVYRDYGVITKDSRDDNHNATSLDTSGYKVVDEGDLVVNKMKAWQGSMGVSEHYGIVSPAYITCRVDAERVSPKFLHYLLRSQPFIGAYNALSYGVRVGQWDMHYEDFKCIPLPLPDRTLQQRIANFLDQKTVEIDEAVAKKQRLIELLKEQKAILINQSVTKGLNPDVTMRDSGVEWIGAVPEHWKIKRLKYLITCPLQYGANEEAKNCVEGDPRYIRITDFSDDGLLKPDTKRTLPEEKAKGYFLNKGDILFARSGATVGKTFLFDSDEISCFAGYLIRATADPSKIDPVYLYLYTKSSAFGCWRDVTFSKATIQNIGADKYSTLPVVIPPLSEQKATLQHIALLEKDINSSLIAAQKQIDLLHEFKQTLIAEAVIGKIKI